MSKANKAALNWLPKRKDGRKRFYQCNDDGVRGIYAKGYRKAEKDLELGWEDVSKIRQIMFDYNRQLRSEIVENKASLPKDEEYCREVLKRFKERKEK